MKLELGKTYKTYCGCYARVVALDRKSPSYGKFTVIALVDDGKEELVRMYDPEGVCWGDHSYDIVPRKVKVKRWVNVYRHRTADGWGFTTGTISYATQALAKENVTRVGSPSVQVEVEAEFEEESQS